MLLPTAAIFVSAGAGLPGSAAVADDPSYLAGGETITVSNEAREVNLPAPLQAQAK